MSTRSLFILALSLFTLPLVVVAQENGFYALTDIPQLEDIAAARNITGFVNLLYSICIGVGGAIAMVQLTRAGIMYAGGESMGKIKEAKALIQTTIFGLILLLVPYIVLSVIDPRITTLNFDASALQLQERNGTGEGNGNANGEQQEGEPSVDDASTPSETTDPTTETEVEADADATTEQIEPTCGQFEILTTYSNGSPATCEPFETTLIRYTVQPVYGGGNVVVNAHYLPRGVAYTREDTGAREVAQCTSYSFFTEYATLEACINSGSPRRPYYSLVDCMTVSPPFTIQKRVAAPICP